MELEEYLIGLIKELENKTQGMKTPIFRGQIDYYDEDGIKTTISSTAARRLLYTQKTKDNDNYLKQSRFIEYHNDLISKARKNGYHISPEKIKELSDFELLAQIQHYGGATCLLDFTENILIALWFASAPTNRQSYIDKVDGQKKEFPSDGKIYIIDIDDEKNHIGFINQEIIKEKTIEQILKIDITGNENKIPINQRQKFWIWKPTKINSRIYSQDSIFFFGLPKFNASLFKEIVIPEQHKASLREILSRFFNINVETVFSDLQGFSNEANNFRVKSHIFDKQIDCLSTAKALIKRKEYNLADSYLVKATNCISKDNSDCSRNISNCQNISIRKSIVNYLSNNRDKKYLNDDAKKYLCNIAYNKAECYNNLDQKNKALAFYEEAIQYWSLDIEAFQHLLVLNYELKHFSEAQKIAIEFANLLTNKEEQENEIVKNAQSEVVKSEAKERSKVFQYMKVSIMFNILELSIFNNNADVFKYYKNEIIKCDCTDNNMGKYLLNFFDKVNDILNNDKTFKDSKFLGYSSNIKIDSFDIYWIFDDMRDWLKAKITIETQNLDNKNEYIYKLLILLERLEETQKELFNLEYTMYDYTYLNKH
jgi:hypothetical protein